ncbi:MAG TPA: DUF4340 domain-containing protein [bacterium]|nr:DUF4340 domain-containing protein [bacterium]
MKTRTLAITVGVLVVLVAASVLVQRHRQGGAGDRMGQPLMGALDMSQAARITLESATTHTTLVATPQGWVVHEQGDFPANQGKLSSFLFKLAGEKIGDKVSEDPASFGDLGELTLAENHGKAEQRKTATVISVLDAQGKPLYQLLLGRDRNAGDMATSFGGRYVRFPGENAVYLVGDNLYLTTDPVDWLSKSVMPDGVTDKSFQSIRVAVPGTAPLDFTRAKATEPWKLAGAKDLDPTQVDTLARNLMQLELATVPAPGKSAQELGRTRMGTVLAHLYDGRSLRLEVGMAKGPDGYRYLSSSASLDPKVNDANLKKAVEAYNATFGNRVVGIQDFDAGHLLRARREFMAQKKSK